MTNAMKRADLESALAGALRAGDLQADELVHLSRLTARQRNAMWHALSLLRLARYEDAALVMKAALDPGSAR